MQATARNNLPRFKYNKNMKNIASFQQIFLFDELQNALSVDSNKDRFSRVICHEIGLKSIPNCTSLTQSSVTISALNWRQFWHPINGHFRPQIRLNRRHTCHPIVTNELKYILSYAYLCFKSFSHGRLDKIPTNMMLNNVQQQLCEICSQVINNLEAILIPIS